MSADGILVVDKPAGVTSHDVVAILRRAFKLKKVGHTGTLDPLATGVLPLCIGKATRLAGRVINSDKSYRVTLELGKVSTSYDTNGDIVSTHPVPPDFLTHLPAILLEFMGEILQTPPPYSAVKRQGKPLYWWARRGVKIEVPPRPIRIDCLELEGIQGTSLGLKVDCSKGTYIRTLGHDIGQRLGCGAVVSSLRRLRSGPFELAQAITLDEIKRASPHEEALLKWIIPISDLLKLLPPEPSACVPGDHQSQST